LAQTEKTGACFIEFPENVAELEAPADAEPLWSRQSVIPAPAQNRIEAAAAAISKARHPIILAGHGVVRAGASEQLADFAAKLNIPVTNTFMAKGVVPFKHPTALGSAGLQAKDYVGVGFDKADVIICVGYDLVEYHPYLWHPTRDRFIIHIDFQPAEVDAHYGVRVGVVGNIKESLQRIGETATPHRGKGCLSPLREALIEDMKEHANSNSWPVQPQKVIWDLRTAMDLEDIAICDVGAHKMWMARMFRCEHPNTCIISNGFASMGIAVPGAIAAKLAFPDKAVVAVTGDAGFLMNSQEIETALRMKTPIVILIWNDAGYGLIRWKQMNTYGRPSHVDFTNPDFVKYAEAFGAKGYRIEKTSELLPTLKKALADNTVSIIDCPVDYSENLRLTAKLGETVFQL
ncbi:MAG TPA: acetolactate synthase large subunit, partial [Candidatus Tenderia sp.]|nr:acetolactate synthase large subunit [Candidatus Tenderia sp.]